MRPSLGQAWGKKESQAFKTGSVPIFAGSGGCQNQGHTLNFVSNA